MEQSMSEATKTALTRMELRFFQPQGSEFVIVPLALSESDLVLLQIQLDEADHEVLIWAELCGVPPRRCTAIAMLLAELNHQVKFVTFSLSDASVHVDSCLDLAFVPDPEPALQRAIARVICVIVECRDQIVTRATKRSRRRSRVEREVAELLRELE